MIDASQFDWQSTKTTPVFVIAIQRSGTNLLRKSLAGTPSFADLNEIFDPFHQQYWTFRQQKISQDPQLALPTQSNQLRLWQAFLKDRLTECSKPFLLIDVKYNSTHHLNGLWHEQGDAPFLVRWIAANQIPVFHLIRRNVFDTHVSNLLACHLQIWESDRTDLANGQEFKLNVTATKKALRKRLYDIDFFRDQMAKCRSIEIFYEDLVSGGASIPDTVVREITEFLRLESSMGTVSKATRKMGRSAKELVINYADFEDAKWHVKETSSAA